MGIFAGTLRNLRFIALLALSLGSSLIAPSNAFAVDLLAASSARANASLNGCGANAGTALYGCVAGVLERLADEINRSGNTETQGALRTAAAGLRAAANKVQALAAISQCQSVINAAIRQSRAIGGELVRGWGRAEGLGPIISVLARAARLIQQKG